MTKLYPEERYEVRPYPAEQPITEASLGVGELKAEKLLRERGSVAVAKALDLPRCKCGLELGEAYTKALDATAQRKCEHNFQGSHLADELVCVSCKLVVGGLAILAAGFTRRDPYGASQLRDELGTAQRDLADARASEEEARADAVVLRRRVSALTEQVRRLRVR
jgi:hypothetical protein